MQDPVLYRGLGDHMFYNMYIYIFITYYMRFLYIFPYPYCESAHISHHSFHTTLRMCIESHTFHYLSLWLRYWMEEFVKHSVEKNNITLVIVKYGVIHSYSFFFLIQDNIHSV